MVQKSLTQLRVVNLVSPLPLSMIPSAALRFSQL